jgi:hypothetical protein
MFYKLYKMLNIIDYSDKSFALFGDTKKYKEQLKLLGGKFNSNLKGQSGWIFSKIHKDKVISFMKTLNEEEIQDQNINVEKYSEKSFVIYGNTKEYKDKIKELGGKFNSNLKVGPGWIFSNIKFDKVKEWLNEINIKIDENIFL